MMNTSITTALVRRFVRYLRAEIFRRVQNYTLSQYHPKFKWKMRECDSFFSLKLYEPTAENNSSVAVGFPPPRLRVI